MAGRFPESKMPAEVKEVIQKLPVMTYHRFEEQELYMRSEKEAMLDLLVTKAKLEEDGKMKPGLAACFNHAMEMLRKDESVFSDCRLIIQADGNFLEFRRRKFYETCILWYDPHREAVQKERLDHYF